MLHKIIVVSGKPCDLENLKKENRLTLEHWKLLSRVREGVGDEVGTIGGKIRVEGPLVVRSVSLLRDGRLPSYKLRYFICLSSVSLSSFSCVIKVE